MRKVVEWMEVGNQAHLRVRSMKPHLSITVFLLTYWMANAGSLATAEPPTAQEAPVASSLSVGQSIVEMFTWQNGADKCAWLGQCDWFEKSDGLEKLRWFIGQPWFREHAWQHAQSRLKAWIRACAVSPADVACYGLWLDASWQTAPADLPVVILIHGFNSTPEATSQLLAAVHQAGYPCGSFAYPNDYTLAASARLLSSELKDFAVNHPTRRVVLLCHSMGGLVARGCLEEARIAPGNVDRLIMVSPPNHGTNLALFAVGTDLWEHWGDRGDGSPWERFHDSVTDGLGEAVTELCPGSEFLLTLNSRPRNPHVTYSILLGDRGFISDQDRLWIRSRLQKTVGRIPGSRDADLDALLAEFDEVVEGRGDGVVAISRGQLKGVADTVVLPYRHFLVTAKEDPAATREVAKFVLSRLK
jgi:pimeloyl-ACP methyl ester carboxylesterase